MKIVCLSDTHNCNEQIEVPAGDILIHAGDATTHGTVEQISAFNEWFAQLPHPIKIFVAGNHDWLFETDNPAARSLLDESIIYLEDSSVEIEGLKIYGSPWQPRYFDWAFNLDRGPQLAEKWSLIPPETNILITHTPPKNILDKVPKNNWWGKAGCQDLRRRVEVLREAGQLKLHIFGHVHSGYGQARKFGVTFVNASTCDEEYNPTHSPIVVEI